MISVVTNVFCDGCSNWQEYGATSPDRAQIRKARLYAKSFGWINNRNGDFCPKCVRANLHISPVEKSEIPAGWAEVRTEEEYEAARSHRA